jgi:hypothetical protein
MIFLKIRLFQSFFAKETNIILHKFEPELQTKGIK